MTAIATRSCLPTPLHARTAELCATNAWVEEGGFTVPARYTSAREEADALVSRVALCDLSARQCWSVQGPDAAAFLSAATVGDPGQLDVGGTVRTAWCDDAGFVRGDGWIARVAKSDYELWTTVRDFAWFADAASGFDVKLANATGARAVIGLRGPMAPALLAASGLTARMILVRDAAGEGVDLSMQGDDGPLVWDRLWRAGAGFGIAAIGAHALDERRIENAIPLAGIDWMPAQFARTPADLRVPADLGFTPDATRRFNGAAALRALKAPRSQVLVQFASDQPLAPGQVTLRGIPVGHLTSHAWLASRACSMALGWIDPDAVKPATKFGTPGATGPVRAEIVRQVFPAE